MSNQVTCRFSLWAWHITWWTRNQSGRVALVPTAERRICIVVAVHAVLLSYGVCASQQVCRFTWSVSSDGIIPSICYFTCRHYTTILLYSSISPGELRRNPNLSSRSTATLLIIPALSMKFLQPIDIFLNGKENFKPTLKIQADIHLLYQKSRTWGLCFPVVSLGMTLKVSFKCQVSPSWDFSKHLLWPLQKSWI